MTSRINKFLRLAAPLHKPEMKIYHASNEGSAGSSASPSVALGSSTIVTPSRSKGHPVIG
jgi:hypothetical protein